MEKVLTAVLSKLVRRGTLTVVTARGKEFTFGDGSGEEIRIRFMDRATRERNLALVVLHRLGADGKDDAVFTFEMGEQQQHRRAHRVRRVHIAWLVGREQLPRPINVGRNRKAVAVCVIHVH